MKKLLVVPVALQLAACASLNVKKTCYADGVCRVDRNGAVSYEGPPDKVAQYQAKDQQKADTVAQLDQAYAEAPKRPANEPVRVAVVGPTSDDAALAQLAPRYREMVEGVLRADPRVQLVPYDQVKMLVEARSGDEGPSFGQQASRAQVDEALTRRLRDFNAAVDVVLVVHLTPKADSKLVGGGGGIGVADVVNVQFDASVSSVYQFSKLENVQVGQSTDSVKLAGFDKNGKKGSANLKGSRNPERDRPAVNALGAWATQAIEGQIAPTLPSMAALDGLHQKNRDEQTKSAPAWLQKLMQKKQ
jgi:hypothetical protein